MSDSLANCSSSSSQDSLISSMDLANLTGKQHGHIMRDIRKMVNGLKGDISGYTYGFYEDNQGKQRPFYALDKALALTLITSYTHDIRFKVFTKLNLVSVLDLLSDIDASGLSSDQYVYVAVERVSGRYKIGISKHPHKRVEDLSRMHPEGLDLVSVYRANEEGRLSEKLVHDALSRWRLNGEWFSKDTPISTIQTHFKLT